MSHSWLTMSKEYNTAKETLAKNGLKSFTNFYKAAVRSLNYTYDASKRILTVLLHSFVILIIASLIQKSPRRRG